MLNAALEQYQAERFAEAAQTCQQILQQQSNHVGALHLIGLIAARQDRFEQAIAIYRRVIDLHPPHLEAHNNLGIALMQLGRTEEAIACYRQALTFAPHSAEVRVNLGNALQAQGKIVASIRCYEQALARNPNLAAAHKNLAHVLRMQGQLAAALLHHQRSIALSPHDAEAHFGYAFTLLISGDLQAGFAEYEWRWRLAYNPPRNFTQPRWDGSPLNGRTLLLWAEQGFGDTLQFIRDVPQLARQGRVIVECQAVLRSLLTSVPGVTQVIAQGETLPNFDLQAPLLSVPHLLKTTLAKLSAGTDTIPASVPYLQPTQSIELPKDPFKIGIAWTGDPKNPINQRRSCPFDQFLKLRLPNVTLYSLQKDCPIELPEDVIDLSDRLQDFAD
ncbi:MAG: tetratricopeptide repeat protein, partial [Microcoleus sp. SIO2G3]|nr:tetratricopeptide repeat protein [Microcoleus sp. SIO2G3]